MITDKNRAKKVCKFCARVHPFKKKLCPAWGKELCPAWGKSCSICSGKNHISQACKKNKKAIQQKGTVEKTTKPRRVKKIDKETESEEETEEEEDTQVFKISKINKIEGTKRKGRAELNFKFVGRWERILCDLDTCSEANVIGFKRYCKLVRTSNPTLRLSNDQLRSFGGDPFKTMGEVIVPCLYKRRKHNIIFQVVDVDHGPLLSERTCLTLGLVKYCFKLSKTKTDPALIQGRLEAERIIAKHKSIFEGYGLIPGEVELEVDPNIPPVIQRARRIPICVRKDLENELEVLEKENIIVRESEPTDWVHNILLVKKKNNSLRICVDPVPLNTALKRPHFQFTTLDEILPEIGRARVFSTVDTKKGFWQIKLSEKSSKLTTFWTPFCRYRWVRLPFGVSPAPESFAQKMQEIIQGLKGIEILVDDILVYGCGETMEEATRDHNKNLEELVLRLEKNGYTLRKLTREDTPWAWTSIEDNEFRKIKTLVANIHSQQYFNPQQPITIECDASATGLGVAVYQLEQVVGYASRTLTPTEKNYAQIEKEMLAIVFGCTRFDQIIAAPKRLQLMLMTLQRYNLEVQFVKGKENVVADTLSRAALKNDNTNQSRVHNRNVFEIGKDVKVCRMIEKANVHGTLRITPKRVDQIREATLSDTTMQRLVSYIVTGWPRDSQQDPPMQSHEILQYPFQFISMDVFFTEYKGKKRKFLVTVDHYSDFFELDILPDMSAETLVQTCRETFSRHGISYRVCSNNGTNFENKLMRSLGQEWGFELVTSAPNHQQGNGKAEAAVKIAKKLVKKSERSGQDLWYMLLHWRNTPNRIGFSPVQRLYSRGTRSGLPNAICSLQPRIIQEVPARIEHNRRKSKYYYDMKSANLPELEIGQPVALQLHPDKNNWSNKGTVHDKLSKRDYIVNVDGARSLTSANVGSDYLVVPCKLRMVMAPVKRGLAVVAKKFNIESMVNESTRVSYEARFKQHIVANSVGKNSIGEGELEHDIYGGQQRIWKVLRGMKETVNENIEIKSIDEEAWARYFETLYLEQINEHKDDIPLESPWTITDVEVTTAIQEQEDSKRG
ncbi:hypothetical protein DMN91_008552 [Ooceraea biroi]|uniref:Integrase catalytic domain-containing protein n=1 Tax=Ooceraea biroi TaxID=2015173 RepID=A0A3L8DIM7_OOCBI|nr:hypothetical protein DMN91_008552 [Ooceraea biroi]